MHLSMLNYYFFPQLNRFACEMCNMAGKCSEEDQFIPIEQAMEQVKRDVPSLMQLIREKVTTIAQTREKLGMLLNKVDQEKVCP